MEGLEIAILIRYQESKETPNKIDKEREREREKSKTIAEGKIKLKNKCFKSQHAVLISVLIKQ